MDTVIEILIDVSGSMGTMKGAGAEEEDKYLLPDRSTRISLAKQFLIEQLIPTIYYASKVIIRTFCAEYSKEGNPVITVLYNDVYNNSSINLKLNSLPDDTSLGGTPITAAVIAAVNNLKSDEYLNFERLIFLVTDGGENVGGDYKAAIEEAENKDGIKCKVHIIGISLDAEAEKKAKQLAAATQGIYVPLVAKNYNQDEIKLALAPLKIKVLKESLENIKLQHEIPGPLVTEKIESLEKKLEKVEQENRLQLFEGRFNSIQSTIQEMEVKLQKQLSEIVTSFEKQKIHESIDTLEKSISKKLDSSISGLKQGLENIKIQTESIYKSFRQKTEALQADILTISGEASEALSKQLTLKAKIEELLKRLVDLEQRIDKNNKRQQTNFYVTWALLLLIAFGLFLFFKR